MAPRTTLGNGIRREVAVELAVQVRFCSIRPRSRLRQRWQKSLLKIPKANMREIIKTYWKVKFRGKLCIEKLFKICNALIDTAS